MVDILLTNGYQNISVLDISAIAIQKTKQRLGEKGNAVHWIISDIIDFAPTLRFDCWHDRAAFHFLTTEEKISRYIAIAENSIKQNGYLIISTFSKKGPQKCSGLDITQYSESSMMERWEHAFEKVNCVQEDHITPSNTTQNFLFCCFRKK